MAAIITCPNGCSAIQASTVGAASEGPARSLAGAAPSAARRDQPAQAKGAKWPLLPWPLSDRSRPTPCTSNRSARHGEARVAVCHDAPGADQQGQAQPVQPLRAVSAFADMEDHRGGAIRVRGLAFLIGVDARAKIVAVAAFHVVATELLGASAIAVSFRVRGRGERSIAQASRQPLARP